MQTENNSARVGDYFDSNWSRYLEAVNNNALYHQEMFSALDTFLKQHPETKNFTLADLGCGDSSAIVSTLQQNTLQRYIGVDTATHVLQSAEKTLANVNCEKIFICEDMGTAIANLPEPIEIIFTSYALHHLSYAAKIKFLADCQNKLTQNGHVLLIDGVLEPKQTRAEWLEDLKNRMFAANPHITQDEIQYLMRHPEEDDFPESIATFQQIAKEQEWQKFEVLVDKGMYAFMVFQK